MNKAEKLDAAIGCIDERYLELADITGREITRMKNDTAVFSRRKAVRIALLAAVAAVLLTVGPMPREAAAPASGRGMTRRITAASPRRHSASGMRVIYPC